ncbi:hypothetical protein Nepgr_029347 [Nepenthes gracilis]|uniref:Uncharacterized protein n=1 Tax=Nepenthes gracilis TaxID=150966 RepID=A0AAD3TDW1_NEPGR|nr:hypothetical protein Nepgr_029347 [Nepenthes gracilis]
MSSSGGMEVRRCSLVVMLAVSVWIFNNSSEAGAVRLFPNNVRARMKLIGREDAFRKFFNGRSPFQYANNTIDDGKRRVPSCSDPLHN